MAVRTLTWEDVLNTAIDLKDELEELSSAQQTFIIDEAVEWVPETKFLSDTFTARRFYAAHSAVLAIGPAAGEGTVSGESIGGVSRSVTLAVNNPAARDRILSTVFGEKYFHYEKKHFQAMFVG